MSAFSSRCAIAIMAKAPIPGRSKTRLCPPLTPDEAASLSGVFIHDMAATLLAAGRSAPIDPFIAYAPEAARDALQACVPPGPCLIFADGAGIDEPGVTGFGRALVQTLRHLFARGYGAACVLNSDSPTLPPSTLIEAAAAIRPGQAVMGPATDGGYYLLGLAADCPAIFADIAWSTSAVADQTRSQAAKAGLALAELTPWYDVDDAASLTRLRADIARAPEPIAPATTKLLANMNLAARLTAHDRPKQDA